MSQVGAARTERSGVDRPAAIAAASYLIALNALIINVQPLILGALAKGYALGDRQLGYVSAVFVGFNTLATVSGPLWVRRVDWRLLSWVALGGATACLAAGGYFSQLASVLFLFALIGAFKGAVFIPSFASLGDTSNPDRSYAVSTVLQGVSAAAVAAPLSAWIIPNFGVHGLFLTLAAVMSTGLVAICWLPRAGDVQRKERTGQVGAKVLSGAAIAPAIGLLALGCFGGGAAAFWYFVERIGADRGVAPALIGMTLSLTALASIVTAAIVAWIGGRLPSLAIAVGGVCVMLFGFASLHLSRDIGFVAANLLFSLGWGLSTPGFWAVLAKIDATTRLFVVAPAASGLAAVIVGLVAGAVIEAGSYAGLIGFSSTLLMVSALLIVAASLVFGRLPISPKAAPANVR
ncbi:MFS transporter [Phenylobacterium sp.]|uniref:MFS transporter n=1 Tax=Phenylobacterium sp. TaxID=1871053 RepID=UPI002C0A77C9|nr:MFS transporter [Phenylobacterium sp.]HVI33612.1 MFS transporter [Phenylobacterium sp.]